VRHYLPLAAEHAAEDLEHVHQLRVATRRASSAVWIFRKLLSNKAHRGMKRVLRAIRRAAGEARDWDVFLTKVIRENDPAADFLTGYALQERLSAQDAIKAVAAEQAAAIQEVCASVPAAVHNLTGQDRLFGDQASQVLGDLFKRFNTEVMGNPTSPEELHQLRITTKRLRYSIEVFAGCCAASLREEVYPAIEEAQEVLGTIQDADVASTRLDHITSELRYLPASLAERLNPTVKKLADELRGNQLTAMQKVKEWIDRWNELNSKFHDLNL
jgi:CHAD domain-containing protein